MTMDSQPKPVTRESVLAAILTGDRTKQEVADRHGVSLDPIRGSWHPLSRHLTALVCADLLCMQVVDRQWHYLPTESAAAPGPRPATTAVNEWDDSSEAPAPCQPIGCDAGLHLPGCYWSVPADSEDCARCGHEFDPNDKAFDGSARYQDTKFCRSCVDRCHESTDFMHACPVCQGGDHA